jgi:mono/diheme cytochrome c family protein
MARKRMNRLIAFLSVLGAAAAAAQTGTPPSAARGELLYSTHCGSCHTTQVHWRDRRLASNWTKLQAQVRRWQRNAGLSWSEEEILDVTRYLNTRFYHFVPPARQADAQPEPRRVASGRGE